VHPLRGHVSTAAPVVLFCGALCDAALFGCDV
jgi:hypothetical protein